MNILIIDGQGGRMGKSIIEGIRAAGIDARLTAVGTNSLSTSTMLKSGADRGATGENSVVVCSRDADVIIGPIGIVIADSLLGEVTEKMAVAVAKSRAKRLLIPINQCDNIVVGIDDLSINTLINSVVEQLKKMSK